MRAAGFHWTGKEWLDSYGVVADNTMISNGYHHQNRLGYYITEEPAKAGVFYCIFNDEAISNLFTKKIQDAPLLYVQQPMIKAEMVH